MSAAIRLAGQGYRVTVLENLERPGGKLGEGVPLVPLSRIAAAECPGEDMGNER